MGKETCVPGPQYMVRDQTNFKIEPSYTIGQRRASLGLKIMTSTPGAIGPGRYVPEACANPSNRLNAPRFSLPKDVRPEAGIKRFDKH